MMSYLEQLEDRCRQVGLDLADVCEQEGVAATTLARWRKGEATCREGTVRRLFDRIDAVLEENAAA